MPDEEAATPPPCLEPEVLAAYIDGNLPPDERARAEAHLAACEDCYALLTEVVQTADEMSGVAASNTPAEGMPSGARSTAVLRPAFGRRGWTIASLLLALAAALIFIASPRC